MRFGASSCGDTREQCRPREVEAMVSHGASSLQLFFSWSDKTPFKAIGQYRQPCSRAWRFYEAEPIANLSTKRLRGDTPPRPANRAGIACPAIARNAPRCRAQIPDGGGRPPVRISTDVFYCINRVARTSLGCDSIA